eukprot:jgi/Picre1/34150/NNA_001625.t1
MDTSGPPADEPRGLAKSLDDLISEQRKNQRQSKGRRRSRPITTDNIETIKIIRRDGMGKDGGRRKDFARKGEQEKAALAGLQRQNCYLNNEGNVAIGFDGTDVVQIAQNGDVKIHLDGKRDDELVESLNYTLAPIGIKLTKKGEEMSVSDGRALVRYHDGIVLGGKGNMFRGSMVMTAFHGQDDIGRAE